MTKVLVAQNSGGKMESTSTKVVYTAVFGNYDLVPEVNPKWNCDFVCFTDNPEIVSHGWQVVKVKLNGEHPAQMNRRYKMLPHKYLPHHELSLYVDGNIRIVTDPCPLFEKYLNNGVIAIAKHPSRNCVYAEAQECIDRELVNKVMVEQQMVRYATQGFPEKYGLTANGIILRKHFDENVIALMDSWWREYSNGEKRDQLS
ncbi:MAG: glycosyltransferase domain-containing protein, partial [Deltaproteobacteria bacterium]